MWWGGVSVSQAAGGALIALTGSYMSQYWGWRFTMVIPGALSIIVSFFLIDRLRDSPQQVGIVFLEHLPFKRDQEQTKKQELPIRVALFEHIIKNKAIWLLGPASFLHYIIRYALGDWGLLLLVEEKNFSRMEGGTCMFWFEIGAAVGVFAAGLISDRVFKSNRGPVNVLCMVGVTFGISLLWSFTSASFSMSAFILFFIRFFISGPQSLSGMAAAELSPSAVTGTAIGVIGLFSGIGASVAGYPLSLIIQSYGWNVFLSSLNCISFGCLLLLLPLWSYRQ